MALVRKKTSHLQTFVFKLPLPSQMCMHHMRAVPTEARRGCQIFWNYSDQWLLFCFIESIYLFIYLIHLVSVLLFHPGSLYASPSPFSLEREDPGLGISSPTEARECCLFRDAGSTDSHTDSGTALAPDVWVTHIKTKYRWQRLVYLMFSVEEI